MSVGNILQAARNAAWHRLKTLRQAAKLSSKKTTVTYSDHVFTCPKCRTQAHPIVMDADGEGVIEGVVVHRLKCSWCGEQFHVGFWAGDADSIQ